jgi:protocatechuate 3,4-dioxygenase beta subunit
MNSNRRDFLKKGSLGVLAASIIPFISKASNMASCEATTEDILGPFFSEGAPQTNTIVPIDYEGEKLFLNGRLSNTSCEDGLANVVLDFWQADENGAYDNDGFKFRGKVLTDSEGNYNLETIVPGKYLNGSNYRPAHIHLKVQAEGYEELVTQIYFEGDVSIQSDHWASDETAINRIIPLNSGIAGDWFGTFDIILTNGIDFSVNELQREYGDLSQNYPNPFTQQSKLFLVLNKDANTSIEIYNQEGKLVESLLNQKMPKGRYELNWNANNLANGIYTAVWQVEDKLVKTIKLIKQN